jgi:hypothetical protein
MQAVREDPLTEAEENLSAAVGGMMFDRLIDAGLVTGPPATSLLGRRLVEQAGDSLFDVANSFRDDQIDAAIEVLDALLMETCPDLTGEQKLVVMNYIFHFLVQP